MLFCINSGFPVKLHPNTYVWSILADLAEMGHACRGHHHFRGEGSKYQQKVVTSFMEGLKTDSKKPPRYKGCRNITVRPFLVLFRTCDLLRLFWLFSRHTLCCKCLGSFTFLWCKMPMFWRAGMREGGRKATPTSISIFDFYGIETLWFEFGNDIFTGSKMLTLSSWRSSISLHKVAEKRAFQL